MKNLKWLTEIVSTKTKIFVTPHRYDLAKHITKLLQNFPAVELVGEGDDYDLVLYLAGFDKHNWSETVQYTRSLHHSLDQALNRKAKLVLITPSTASTFGQVARSVVEQFGKNFGLNYLIVETGESKVSQDTAVAVLKAFIPNFSVEVPKPIPAPVKTKTKEAEQKHPGSARFVLIGLLILLSPWLLLGALTFGAWLGVRCVDWGLNRDKWDEAIACSRVASSLAKVALPLSILAPTVELEEPLKTAALIGPTLTQAVAVGDELLPYFRLLILGGTNTELISATDLTSALTAFNESLNYLSSQTQSTSLSGWVGNLPTRFAAARGVVNKLGQIAPVLDKLTAVDGLATWVVLLQDNTEVRPTGGFVDGLAILKIENGHIATAQFLPTTAADAELRGQVEPPADMKLALGEKSWYLRDSNWDPDFSESAARAAWFVEKELDHQVDGVVAVNLSTLSQLLKILGPVELVDFGGSVTSQNWTDNYLRSVKLDAPQSRFLPQLAEELFNKTKAATPQQLRQVASVMLAGLESRQALVWSSGSAEQAALSQAGWAGEVNRPGCASAYPCVNQYVYLVDANVSVNKTDPLISRHAVIHSQVDQDQVVSRYTWRYTHSGVDSSWPGGEYKDYVRIYFPLGFSITDITVDGEDFSSQVTSLAKSGLNSLGFLWSLGVGETSELSVEFTTPTPKATRWHYQLLFPNQPGVAPYPLAVEVAYPTQWWVTADSADEIASSGKIGYNSKVDRYLRWNMDLVPTQ